MVWAVSFWLPCLSSVNTGCVGGHVQKSAKYFVRLNQELLSDLIGLKIQIKSKQDSLPAYLFAKPQVINIFGVKKEMKGSPCCAPISLIKALPIFTKILCWMPALLERLQANLQVPFFCLSAPDILLIDTQTCYIFHRLTSWSYICCSLRQVTMWMRCHLHRQLLMFMPLQK